MNTCIKQVAARTLAIHFLIPVPSHGRGSRDRQCPDSFAENISFSERNESLMAVKKYFNGTTNNKLNIGLFEGNSGLFFERGHAYCFPPGRNN
jgi:hypothetical protein